jgi:membrane protein implicated in regulation of membrane protease activity
MDEFGWILWIVLGVILIIAEIFTLGFVLLGFGIGALAAALAGFLGAGLVGQFLIFALVSIVLTVFSRKIFGGYYLNGNDDLIKTGSDSLPGQIGTVTSPSRGALQSAEVKVFGSTWTAFPEEGETPLAEGEKVEVVRLKGASIYVRKVNELPEWRENK